MSSFAIASLVLNLKAKKLVAANCESRNLFFLRRRLATFRLHSEEGGGTVRYKVELKRAPAGTSDETHRVSRSVQWPLGQ